MTLFLRWFLVDAPRIFLHNGLSLATGFGSYFSISFLITTLFDPWRHDAVDMSRLPVRYWSQAILNNITSRFIGFTMRSATILVGVCAIGVSYIGTLLFVLGWYALPLLLVASMFYGLQLVLRGLYA